MNYWLLRYCCVALTLAALMLGTSFVPLHGGAQAQDKEDLEKQVFAGSTVFALATNPGLVPGPQRLVGFEANSPGTLRSDVAIQGLQANERLVGIDFRPSNGQLYGLGSTGRLYTINFSTGVATSVGAAAAISPADFFAFDFNPIPDAIRVIAGVSDQNLRLNPTTGAIAGTDTNVAYRTEDVNAGDLPNIVGAAYDNNFPNPPFTTLYAIDARASGGNARLVTVGGLQGGPSPNTGQLLTLGNLRTPTGADIETNNLVGFDITSNGNAYVSLTPINPFNAPSSFYTLDIANRTATPVGVIGRDSTPTSGLRIEGIAIVTFTPAETNGILQVSTTTSTVAENVLSVTITVSRNGTVGAPANVDYTTVDGTASSRMDYITAAGTLTIPAGQTAATVTVLIQNDAFQEGSETFSFNIFNSDNGNVTDAGRSVTITITDDDATTATGNPIDGPDFFVRQQYRDFLNRDPDAPGFAFWTGEYARLVGACATVTPAAERSRCETRARASISSAFFLSVEFQQTGYVVYRAYDVAFARIGTPRPARGQPVARVAVRLEEFLRDTQTIGRGVVVNNAISQAVLEANRQAYFLDFVQRPDFTDRFPVEQSGTQFVDALFASANITPTAAERTAVVTALGGGGTSGRAAAFRAVVENEQLYQREFNRSFVLLQYFGYLRRNPDDAPEPNRDLAGYNFWLNKLDAASTSTPINSANPSNDPEALGRVRRAEMIEAFIVSAEYQMRFGVVTRTQ